MNQASIRQRKKKGSGSSQYRGVSWNKWINRWAAGIRLNGKWKPLGTTKTEQEALELVNKAYAKYFPDYPEFQQQYVPVEMDLITKFISGKL